MLNLARNICVSTKLYRIKEEIKRVEDILEGRGRILVRLSGTEPIIRVMLEGEDYAEISRLANETAAVIKERLS